VPYSMINWKYYGIIAVFIASLFAPLIFQEYVLNLIAAALLLGLFSAAVDLSIGYGGLLNLGSAMYFGLGAYCLALTQQAGWNFFSGLAIGVFCAFILSALIGFIGLKLQRSMIQYALLGLVISLSLEQLAIGSYSFAGGSNGITNIAVPDLLSFIGIKFRSDYYYYVVILTGILLFCLSFITRSHFGKLLLLVRDEPGKAASLGYNVDRVKISVTMITAIVSAIAGAFYVPLINIAYPGMFSVTPNMLVLVWIAVGGVGTLIGPFVLAAALHIFEFELGSQFVDWYMFVLGIIFVGAVMLHARGVHTLMRRFSGR